MNKSLELLKNTKKDNISDGMLVDVWLEEFFNITLKHLETDSRFYKKDGTFKQDATRKFYKIYAITEEQHIWWSDLMMKILPKKFKTSKEHFKKSWSFMYLNCAPSVKQTKK